MDGWLSVFEKLGAVEGAVGGAVEGAFEGGAEGTVGGAVEGAIEGAVEGAVVCCVGIWDGVLDGVVLGSGIDMCDIVMHCHLSVHSKTSVAPPKTYNLLLIIIGDDANNP